MWIVFALGASVLWGLSYVLFEQIYKKISVITGLGLACLVIAMVMLSWAWWNGNLKPDLATVVSSKKMFWLVAGGVATALVADLFIGLSIHGKSATLAGLIEISYPIFIVLFAYLLFKEHQINLPTAIGGILVFIGVFVIYFFNR